MNAIEDFDKVEQSKYSVTKNSLTFLLDGVDPRDLAADGFSVISYGDSEWSAGGVREAPTCQELAIEGECLTKLGNHKEAIPLLESALELGTDDTQLLSVLWSLLGNAHFYLGNYKKASICHQHDLAICNELGDKRNQAQAYCNLGIANRKTGYLQRARLCYECYLDTSERIEDFRSKSKAHHNLGDLHLTLGRLKLHRHKRLANSPEAKDHLTKAVDYFKKHLEYVKQTQNRSAEARAHASLGYVYELLQNVDEAIDHYEMQLKIAVEISDKGAEGRSYSSIGNCLRAMIQPDKSLDCYKRGLAIARELKDELGEAVVSGNIGMAHEMLCNLDSAEEYYKQQLDSMKSQDNLHGEAMALDNIARTYQYMNNSEKAYESLETLLSLKKKLKQEEEVEEVTSRINKLNEMCGGTFKLKDLVKGGVRGGGEGKGGMRIWNRLKAKKKKLRNLTSPEIDHDHLRAVISSSRSNSSLTTLKENEDDWKEVTKGKEKKRSKVKSSKETKAMRKKSKDVTGTSKSNEVVMKNNLALSLSDSEEVVLSQRSNTSQTLPVNWQDIQEQGMPPLFSPVSRKRIVLKQLDLSQTSDKNPITESPSLSGNFIGNEENFSTQSSSDMVVLNSSSAAEMEAPHTQEDGDSNITLDSKESRKDESEHDVEFEYNFSTQHTKGSTTLYKEYGSEEHKLNLENVQEFLESSGEMEPVDLKLLQDWDGWIVAIRDITIPSTKESQLI